MSERNNEPGEYIEGTPRSLQEMAFAAGARACAHCGDRSELHWKHGGSGEVWRTHATCPSCGEARVYIFHGSEDLFDADPPELELGEGVSSVLDPYELVLAIERIEPSIRTPLEPLTNENEANWDRLERVQTALNELAKFIAPGMTAIAATAMHSEAGRADLRARSLRYSKQWIDSEIVRYRELVDAVSAPTATPIPEPSLEQRGSIDRDAIMAHRQWHYLGKGARLDVAGVNASRARLDGTELIRARFERVDLRSANIDQSDWSESELRDCKLDNARLNHLKLAAATIVDSTFDGAAGAILDVSKGTVSGSSFARVGMPGCDWNGATVSHTNFNGASFGNARFDSARFTRCDFVEASLEPDRDFPPMRMRGAVFEDCDFRRANFNGVDFRGATFKRCKLSGTRGEPKFTSELTLTDCDISEKDLLRQLVPPTLTIDQVHAHPAYVVARDYSETADAMHVVFDIGNARAKRLARTRAPATASTCGRNGIVWITDDETFTIFAPDGRPFTATRTEIRTPGGLTPVDYVIRVVSFIDPKDFGRRGVAIVTPLGRVPRLVIVQELDMIAWEDKSFTVDDARRDGQWAALLGDALAQWLGVPHDTMRTDFR